MDTSGWLLVFSIILLSGVIAYLGDTLGRRIGKRKLSLLTLRPRYTAILVSIVTGVLIATTTLAILSIASQDVRTALFGMAELKEKLENLNREVFERNMELENTKKAIDTYRERVTELEVREKELQASKMALEQSMEELKAQRQNLQEEVQTLQVELDRLRANIIAIRQGEIVFQDDEEILRVVVTPGLSEEKAREYLLSLIARADPIAANRGAGMDREGRGRIFVLEENFAETVKRIVESRVPLVVRLVSFLNTLRGEPVIARFVTVENRKVFAAGEVILRREVEMESGKTRVEVVLGEILRELNVLGIERGVLPQQGKVGSISALNLTEVTGILGEKSGKVTIEAVAEGDIFTVGPMRVYLRVEK